MLIDPDVTDVTVSVVPAIDPVNVVVLLVAGPDKTGGVPAPMVNVAVVVVPTLFVATTLNDWLVIVNERAT